MLDTQIQALKRRIRETLESGLTIAVMGWRNNHHTPFTRSLPKKKVRFYTCDDPPKTFGDTVGLVLCAKYLQHKHVERVKNKSNGNIFYPVVIDYRTIISTLESCEDLMIVQPCSLVVSDTPPKAVTAEQTVKLAPAVQDYSDEVLDFLTTSPKGNHQMMNIDRFTKAFLAAATSNKRKEGLVGKKELAKLRRNHGIEETPPELARLGFIVAAPGSNGEQIGWYKAGPKMLEAVRHEKFEPEDPVERAKFLIAQEEALLAERAKLEGELELIQKKLKQVDTAKDLLSQLEALMK